MSRIKVSPSTQRQIPSVDWIVRELGEIDLPRAIVVDVIRRELAGLRKRISGRDGERIGAAVVLSLVRAALEEARRSRIQPVINATGVVIHTNFGRSPLADAAVDALTAAAMNYTNLEYDLTRGARGARGEYVERALAVLCGAPAATVVNNCAGALVLVLRHFAADAARNEVIISRGELVQIGGGFRIPEILEASGATLREVGTTNKTTAADYERAMSDRTALVLKVHHSNFYMEGFVESPSTPDISGIARRASVPFLIDLGSGATFDTAALGAEHEPTPKQELSAGADLVCFSGDKLMGGPQAGIIAGSAEHIAAIKNNSFFRALRCDKLILAALEATVDLLLQERPQDLPVRWMLEVDAEELKARAERLAAALQGLPLIVEIGAGRGQVGGGSLPRTFLSSVTLDLRPDSESCSLQQLAERLRLGAPPVIGYVEHDRLKLDLRTVFPRQDEALLAAIRGAVLST